MNDAVSSFTKSVLVDIVLNSTHVLKQFDREFLQSSSAFALYYPDVERGNRYLSAVLMHPDNRRLPKFQALIYMTFMNLSLVLSI